MSAHKPSYEYEEALVLATAKTYLEIGRDDVPIGLVLWDVMEGKKKRPG